VLEPEAVRALVSGGKWAQWAAGLAGALAALTAFRCLAVVAGMDRVVRPTIMLVGNIVWLPILGLLVWVARRFGNAARAFARDEQGGEVDQLMRIQRQLFKTYGILALVVSSLLMAGLVVGFILGRMSGSGELQP
jgi:hypothetical protein